MQVPYKEIICPSLVNDVRCIFWNHINPYALPKNASILRNLSIDKNNKDHQEMTDLTIRYPFLGYHMLLFSIPPGNIMAIHLDGIGVQYNRHLSCNIPISGCTENGITEFFDADLDDFYTDIIKVTRFLKPLAKAKKIFEYSILDNPVVCDTQKPHRVNNEKSIETRITISWTVKPQWTLNDISSYIASQ